MKVYWEHTCDDSHLWITLEDDSDSPSPENMVCPFGHTAITSQKHIPVNSVEVSIRPAIRIIDLRSGREDFRNSYCVVLSDTHETFAKVSQKVYTWEECIEIVNKFKGMNIKMSLVRWKKMNP
jgi:hypothetical protein